jgi:hypothetical protein
MRGQPMIPQPHADGRTGREFPGGLLHLVLLGASGCGMPDSPALVDLTFPEVVETADEDTAPPLRCEEASDCPAANDCCAAVSCDDGTCRYALVPECCHAEGPCATPAAHLTGACVTPCGAYGCHARLPLSDEACGVVASFDLPALARDGALSVAVDWRGATAGPAWSVDLRAPAARHPTLSLASPLCEALQPGPVAGDCSSLSPWADGWSAEVELPPLRLPAGVPLVVDALLHDGRAGFDGFDPTAPEIRIEARVGPGTTLLWSSSRETGAITRGWRPISADLGAWAGQEVSLRLVVVGAAGPVRDDGPIAFHALTIGSPCAAERAPAGAPGVCGEPVAVRVQGSHDTLHRRVPAYVAVGCEACHDDDACATLESCRELRCQEGRCDAAPRDEPCGGDGRALAEIAPAPLWERSGDAWQHDDATDTWHFPLGALSGTPTGAVVSPPFHAPGPDTELAFALRLETEWDDAGTTTGPARPVDALRIELLPDPMPSGAPFPPAPVVLWESGAIGGTTRGAWLPIRLPLPAAEGALVRVAFRFSAGDDAFNAYDGARIARPVLVRPETPSADARPRQRTDARFP